MHVVSLIKFAGKYRFTGFHVLDRLDYRVLTNNSIQITMHAGNDLRQRSQCGSVGGWPHAAAVHVII